MVRLRRLPIKSLKLELSTKRIEALTDGIFAIAMTLLVLGFEVKAPEGGYRKDLFIQWLLTLWPHFHDFVVSFFILAVFWINHHRQFHFIKRSDTNLLRINIIILMFICLIPFTTELQSSYENVFPAVLVFELNMFLAGLMYSFQWHYVTSGRRLVEKDLDEEVVRVYKWRTLIIPFLSVCAIATSYFDPDLGTSVYLLVPLALMFMKWY